MMNVLVILAHPNKESFNNAIAEKAIARLQENGHNVIFHDLYAEMFDPMLPTSEIPEGAEITSQIEAHCKELTSADGIIVIHPNWWGQPPAILKGWIDRVIRPGTAYRFDEGDGGEGVPIGLLKARAVVVLNTSNTPDEREQSAFGDPLEDIWKRCIFDLCGVRNVHRRMFNVIVTSTEEQRRAWLDEAVALCRITFAGQ